jgi:hypothetical protein
MKHGFPVWAVPYRPLGSENKPAGIRWELLTRCPIILAGNRAGLMPYCRDDSDRISICQLGFYENEDEYADPCQHGQPSGQDEHQPPGKGRDRLSPCEDGHPYSDECRWQNWECIREDQGQCHDPQTRQESGSDPAPGCTQELQDLCTPLLSPVRPVHIVQPATCYIIGLHACTSGRSPRDASDSPTVDGPQAGQVASAVGAITAAPAAP